MPTLREALTQFVDEIATAYEAKEADLFRRECALKSDLAAATATLQKERDEIDGKAKDVAAREANVVVRLASVTDLSKISSDRRARIQVLEANQEELVRQKNEAVAQTRVTEKDKERLEQVINKLTSEKKLLRQQLEIAGGATDSAPAVLETVDLAAEHAVRVNENLALSS